MPKLDQASLDYEAALARRLERLGTRHTFKQAKSAADGLYTRLVKSALVRIASVGIGLNEARTDVTIEVNVEDVGSVKHVPPQVDGIDVNVQVSGPVETL